MTESPEGSPLGESPLAESPVQETTAQDTIAEDTIAEDSAAAGNGAGETVDDLATVPYPAPAWPLAFGPATPAPSVEATEVAAAAAEAARANERLRAEFARVRDGFARLKYQLQGASGLATTSEDLLAEFTTTAIALTGERQELEREKAVLVARERAVAQAEQERDQGYADERSALDRGLAHKRQTALSALEAEIVSHRATLLAEVAEAQSAERERVRSAIARERSDWEETYARQEEELRQRLEELERQKGAVSALATELEGRRVELDDSELDLESRSERARRQAQRRSENLDEDVAQAIAEERTSYRSSLQAATAECDRLRVSLQSQHELLSGFRELQRHLGGRHPGEVILELVALRDEIKRQAEDLATRPPEEMRTRYEALRSENDRLKSQVDELDRQRRQTEDLARQSSSLKFENGNLEAENKSLAQKASMWEDSAREAQAELERLRAAYERPKEIEDRRKEIERPVIKAADIKRPDRVGAEQVDEISWLDRIASAIGAYGLHFSRRILHAFHTSLKTADWSPLTVLAGVSGTGKSELPRLYSHFGGLFFQLLAVQPNWDSQESMLGFFNSIDNKFDAQPVLQFLAQSQKGWADPADGSEGYPGLKAAMCLILLDEMNLAHPELYFAEFLSKLEQRRGMKGDVPSLPVKVGSGMPQYQLPLGRNVLWTGTMNQDETTKSLSDKVLDRSIVIHFPRPTDLKRRPAMVPLNAENRGPTLHRATWDAWTARSSDFTDDEIKPYKEFVEEMNASLAVAGRAIGHRVWQSVEYYMANYPEVRAAGDDSARKAKAMHVAFEDQLVQKVMPKLRGIDTRGNSRTGCLDKIRGQLNVGIEDRGFNLDKDFELALELGYGQFIWQSANYLKADEPDEPA
jgi:hypothetical protein